MAQVVEARALAHHPQQRVALEGRAHHVAAQGHLGVFGPADQLLQAGGAAAQGIEGDQITLGLGQIQAGLHQLRVLRQHRQRPAAEGF
ncbi:MAG: hypothetical protein EOP39_20045 [Rubrivivax sp.]|nr:MAG: hypothetical protein EOP39_20045 [Rubrivivax sp.]